MATASTDTDEIRRQMAQIRRELHEDVRDVVEKAEAVADWHRYIRQYPWPSLGAAFAIGYLIVPKRRRSVPKDVARQADVEQVRAAVAEAVEPERTKEKEKTKRGLIAAAWAMLSPVAIRLAQGYAVNYLESWLLQQQAQQAAAGPRAPGGPGRAGRPGGR